MAKYRLLTKHYMYDQLLEEGTIVGDDTPFKIEAAAVSPDMEGLDDEAKAQVQMVRDNATKPLATAPQLGLLYLEPEVQSALVEAAKRQQGAATMKAPEPVTAPRK
jgi:hypothetical protein